MLDLIIIGAGPAGLLAAYHAQRYGLKYMVLEKGRIGQSWRKMQTGMMMLSPGHWKMDWTSLCPDFPIWKMDVNKPFARVEDFVRYLNAYADNYSLKILERSEVVDISATEDFFRIYTDNFHLDSKYLLVATGIFHNPYFPDIPGIDRNPLVCHNSQIRDLAPFRGKRIAIVGAGNSAVETAITLCGDSDIVFLCRDKVKYYSETGVLFHIRGIYGGIFRELVEFNLITCLENCNIERIEGGKIYCEKIPNLNVDAIILATGYRPATLPVMGAQVEKNSLGIPTTDSAGESVSIPGLFFAGGIIGDTKKNSFIHSFRPNVEKAVIAAREKIHGPMMKM